MRKFNLVLCSCQRDEWLFYCKTAANKHEDQVLFLSLVNRQASLYESDTLQVAEVLLIVRTWCKQLFLYLWHIVLGLKGILSCNVLNAENWIVCFTFSLKLFLLRWNSHNISHFKVNNSLAFSTVTILYNYQLYQVPKYFYYSIKKSHT